MINGRWPRSGSIVVPWGGCCRFYAGDVVAELGGLLLVTVFG